MLPETSPLIFTEQAPEDRPHCLEENVNTPGPATSDQKTCPVGVTIPPVTVAVQRVVSPTPNVFGTHEMVMVVDTFDMDKSEVPELPRLF